MESLIQSLSLWSYVFLFAVIFVECAGVPLPGFSVALFAAALAGQGQGLDFWAVFSITLLAATLGGMLGYWLGIKGGRVFLERYGRYVLITSPRLAIAEQAFQKHGSKAVLFGRYLPVMCFLGGILGGMARMSYRRFFVYNFLGALFWCSSHLTLGFFFGRSLEMLNQIFSGFTTAALVIVAIAGLTTFLRRRIRSRRRMVSRPIAIPMEERPKR